MDTINSNLKLKCCIRKKGFEKFGSRKSLNLCSSVVKFYETQDFCCDFSIFISKNRVWKIKFIFSVELSNVK